MSDSSPKNLSTLLTEAADRAEVTALLIRCGYRVYRPEADVDGEDLVLRLPDRQLVAVQQKGRATVNRTKYWGKELWMLFPSAPYSSHANRIWFLVPHDSLFLWMEKRHGEAESWGRGWHYPKLPKDFEQNFATYAIRPDDKFTATDMEVYNPDGTRIL